MVISKFSNLTSFLRENGSERISLTFEELERVLGFPLPDSAHRHRAYFSNSTGHSIAQAWLNAGYFVENVNVFEGRLDFVCENRTLLYFYSCECYEEMIKNHLSPVRPAITLSTLQALILRNAVPMEEIIPFMNKYDVVVLDAKGEKCDKSELFTEFNPSLGVLAKWRGFLKAVWLIVLANYCGYDSVTDVPVVNSFVPSISLGATSIDFKRQTAEFDRFYSVVNGRSLSLREAHEIGAMKVNEMSFPGSSEDSILLTAYLRAGVVQAIENSQAYAPYVPPSLCLEWLDLEVVLVNKNARYITRNRIGFYSLLGRARESIVLLDGPSDSRYMERK